MEHHLPVFPNIQHRSTLMEWMDDLARADGALEQALRDIRNVNAQLGGMRITVAGIEQLITQGNTFEIADLGCGLGDIPNAMFTHLSRKGKQVSITGFDANPHIVDRALTTYGAKDGLDFQVANIWEESFQKKQFDIVTLNLFLHHFTEEEGVQLIGQLLKQTRVGIVINDLSRSVWAYWLFRLYAKLAGLGAMAKYDGAVSVLRGFKKDELIAMLNKADVKNYKITYHWAFRWRVIIYAA